MNMIKKDHWYINDNELAITLMRYYVSIMLVNDEGDISFKLTVAGGAGSKEMNLSFSNLEDAIVFTEDVISQCKSFDEIKKVYYDTLYDNKKAYRKVR